MLKYFIGTVIVSMLAYSLLIAEDSGAQTGTISQGGFSMGFGVNSVTFDGKTWTRVNLFPVIPVWKFKFAFDVEFFIDYEGKFSSKGWDFTTLDSSIDTILRKIYYISFSDKNSVLFGNELFYFRFGALDNSSLGLGIIMNNYANNLYYPMEKQLGLEFAVGNISPLKIGLEGVINNFGNIAKGGLVFGTRFFLSPLGFLQIPILDKIQVGITYCADLNQYSGLKDSDGDLYPDVVDKFPSNPKYYADSDNDGTPDEEDLDLDGDNIPDYSNLSLSNKQALTNFLVSTFNITTDQAKNMVDFDVKRASYFNLSNKNDYFSMIGFDIIVPVISIENTFDLILYSQFGMNLDIYQENDTNLLKGWGLAGPGISIKVLGDMLNAKLEYRKRVDKFEAGYFGRLYDKERTVLINQVPITKDNYIDMVGINSANGIYGEITANLFIIYAYGSLEYLVPELTAVNLANMDATFQAKAYLNTNIINQIPVVKDYIDNVEGYFINKNISSFTNFFTPNPNMRFGFNAYIKLGGTTKLKYSFERSFKYDIQNNITNDDIMQIGTETTF